MSEKRRLEIARQVRTLCDLFDAETAAQDATILDLLAKIETMKENHSRRVTELLEANNREVERRRKVEASLSYLLEMAREDYCGYYGENTYNPYYECKYCGAMSHHSEGINGLEHSETCPVICDFPTKTTSGKE